VEQERSRSLKKVTPLIPVLKVVDVDPQGLIGPYKVSINSYVVECGH